MSDRYHFLENEYLKVRIDRQYGGAISGLWVKGNPQNLVDTRDNGRLIQVDCQIAGQKATNWDKNPWDDILHRDIFNPTQGGSCWQEPNWSNDRLVTEQIYSCTVQMMDYWGVGPNGERKTQATNYKVWWMVTIRGDNLICEAQIDGPRIPSCATIWWFGKGFDQYHLSGERWFADHNIVDAPSLAINEVYLSSSNPEAKTIAMWLQNDATGASTGSETAPESTISSTTGVRVWDNAEIDLRLDFSKMIKGESVMTRVKFLNKVREINDEALQQGIAAGDIRKEKVYVGGIGYVDQYFCDHDFEWFLARYPGADTESDSGTNGGTDDNGDDNSPEPSDRTYHFYGSQAIATKNGWDTGISITTFKSTEVSVQFYKGNVWKWQWIIGTNGFYTIQKNIVGDLSNIAKKDLTGVDLVVVRATAKIGILGAMWITAGEDLSMVRSPFIELSREDIELPQTGTVPAW